MATNGSTTGPEPNTHRPRAVLGCANHLGDRALGDSLTGDGMDGLMLAGRLAGNHHSIGARVGCTELSENLEGLLG